MQGAREEVIERQLDHFDEADPDYGRRVREALAVVDEAEVSQSVQPHA